MAFMTDCIYVSRIVECSLTSLLKREKKKLFWFFFFFLEKHIKRGIFIKFQIEEYMSHNATDAILFLRMEVVFVNISDGTLC